MNRKRSTKVYIYILAIGISGLLISSCNKNSMEGRIVCTQVAVGMHDINNVNENSAGHIPGSQIVALTPGKSGGQAKLLTEKFFSACSPDISFSGEFMLFTAQKTENDSWQIWEMNLGNLKARQVTFLTEDCFDPAYLPDGRLVFSKFTANDKVKAELSLYTGKLDGTEIHQITFNPNSYFASRVLKDGRILTISRQLHPNVGDEMFMVSRPDGTKQELFYKGPENSSLHSCGWETREGKIIFIESADGNRNDGDIISINYNRPLHSRVNLTADVKGEFYGVSPFQTGKLLVSYRSAKESNYALYEFDTENKTLSMLYENGDYNILEAIVVAKHERPRKLPSEVDMEAKTGLLLCQDINFQGMPTDPGSGPHSKAVQIEVMGIDSTLGVVDVEEDGSFYLKVAADTPFRIKTIDKDGEVVNGPGSWIYVRPNERRGCIGCHENRELVPENRQPLSVLKDPVNVPYQSNKIDEKQTGLE